jgi:hypothetical protein
MKKNEPVIRQTTQKEGVRKNLFLDFLNGSCHKKQVRSFRSQLASGPEGIMETA